MAKGVGLDAGEFEVKVVELDGSYRKPRLTKVSVDRVAQHSTMSSDPDHATSEATALQHAVKAGHFSTQNVCLGFPSREALFRQLHVPFTGEDRIRKVIKFEAEGEIHGQSVDDMVIDFHIVEELGDETRVLVAGVPKQPLRMTLTALEKVGIEPERVDLDMMGLYRVADWCGALTANSPAQGADDGDGELAVEGARSRVVVDFGARAVRVLVVTNGHLLDMRAIPLGSDSMAEDISTRFDISIDEAREATVYSLSTGEDHVVSASEILDVDESNDDEEESEARNLPQETKIISFAAVDAARDRFVQRLRREFMRFLVAVKGVGTIEATFTTGAGSLMPGIHDLLADVFGCDPEPLSYVHLLSHKLSEEDADYMEPRIAVAVGLALGHMNGVKGFNFRQEDLSFTRGFDRIKLPLAIACMLALFYLFFYGVGLRKQLQAKERMFGYAVPKTAKASSTRRESGKRVTNYMQFTGYLTYLVNEGTWPERNMSHNEYRTMVNKLAEQPTFKRIVWYRNELNNYLKKVQTEGQFEPSLALDSSVAVLQQFAGVIASVEKSLGRFYIGEIGLKLPAASRGRHLSFKVFFRGEQFRERNVLLKNAFLKIFEDKDSAFKDWVKAPKERPTVGDDLGAFVDYAIELRAEVPVKKL